METLKPKRQKVTQEWLLETITDAYNLMKEDKFDIKSFKEKYGNSSQRFITYLKKEGYVFVTDWKYHWTGKKPNLLLCKKMIIGLKETQKENASNRVSRKSKKESDEDEVKEVSFEEVQKKHDEELKSLNLNLNEKFTVEKCSIDMENLTIEQLKRRATLMYSNLALGQLTNKYIDIENLKKSLNDSREKNKKIKEDLALYREKVKSLKKELKEANNTIEWFNEEYPILSGISENNMKIQEELESEVQRYKDYATALVNEKNELLKIYRAEFEANKEKRIIRIFGLKVCSIG
jgi:hypothetical protein